MSYIPKNKITTNQSAISTVESYFIYVNTLALYEGPYYKLANGDMFTGKYPGDGKNEKIKMNSGLGGIDDEHADIVNLPYPTSPTNTLQPTPPLHPTPDDYKFGSFIRYFSKKRNEYIFEELTKSQYDILNVPANVNFILYKPFYIKWMLTGNIQTVTDFNYYSIRKTEENEKVHGLNEYLNMNYTQYYK
jgi:hypothetical protein